MGKILSLLLFLFLPFSLLSASEIDSTTISISKCQEKPVLWKKAIAPASFFIGTSIIRPFDNNIRDFRNDHFPNYKYNYDNILQVTPGIAVLALRSFGVKGRHEKWYEMLTAMAFSTITTTAFTEGFKNTIGRTRPYSHYQRNSFPSGHTMTAFTSATILHNEYGCVSPWYSIGGYSVASIVGVSRILNNRHWASDVLAGAGFGILSGNLGYLMADCLFGKTETDLSFKEMHPSFIGLNANFSPRGNDIPNIQPDYRAIQFNHKYGYGYSIEGAYFPCKHVGIGAKTCLVYNIFEIDEEHLHLQEKSDERRYINFESDYCSQSYGFMPGLYLTVPISKRFLLGCKYLFGIGGTFSFNLDFDVKDKYDEGYHTKFYDEYNFGWSMETGGFCKVLVTKDVALSLSADYNRSNATYLFYQSDDIKKDNYNLIFALGVNVLLD